MPASALCPPPRRCGSATPSTAASAARPTILVANCGSLPGNIELIPDALIDDGMLDIAVIQPKSIFGWLMIWRKVTWENRVLRKTSLGQRIIRFTDRAVRTELSYLRGESVRLTVENPEPFELDGDEFGEISAVDLTVDRRGLKVRVPAVG
jgi:diacylglycerol kinase (ATP)